VTVPLTLRHRSASGHPPLVSVEWGGRIEHVFRDFDDDVLVDRTMPSVRHGQKKRVLGCSLAGAPHGLPLTRVRCEHEFVTGCVAGGGFIAQLSPLFRHFFPKAVFG